jgi:hypothetical protein
MAASWREIVVFRPNNGIGSLDFGNDGTFSRLSGQFDLVALHGEPGEIDLEQIALGRNRAVFAEETDTLWRCRQAEEDRPCAVAVVDRHEI